MQMERLAKTESEDETSLPTAVEKDLELVSYPEKIFQIRRMVMDNLNHLGLSDGIIKSIKIFENVAEIIIEKWNAKELKLIFEECWRLKDRQSTNQEIGDIRILDKSDLIDELIADILEGGGTKEEVEEAVQVTFYEPSDNRIILEIVANSVIIQEIEL